MKSEFEKCLAGEWYACHDPVFLEFKTRARKLMKEYNSLPYEEKEKKKRSSCTVVRVHRNKRVGGESLYLRLWKEYFPWR